MDENMSEDELRAESPVEGERQDSAKRMRTDFEGEEHSVSSNNSENNSNSNDCNEQSASVSSDSGFPLSVEGNGNEQIVDNTEEQNDESENRVRSEEEGLTESDDEDLDSVLSSSGNFASDSTSAENTIVRSSDMDSEEETINDILKKKPKHTWFMAPEIINRQIGYGARKANPSLFQQRCYGSLRNVQKLELMYKLEKHDGCVNSLNFSPDGKFLVSGSDDLKVVIWDWRICKSLMKIETKHRRNIFQTRFLDFKGPELHLATCARDGQVFYIQVLPDGRTENKKLGQHKGPCHKLAVLKDQPHVILSAGEDGVILSHDIRKSKARNISEVDNDGREVALYSIHANPLRTHEFCVSGREAYVRIYDQRKSREPLARLCPYQESDPNNLHITCAVYNHDGSEVLASYNDDDIYLFDTHTVRDTFQYIRRYSGHRNAATIKGVSFFGPRSEFIVSGSDCGHLFFWEKSTEAIAQFLLADDNGVVNCVEPHPELPFVATSGLDWDVKLWVPSCEDEPVMRDLPRTVRKNRRECWNTSTDQSDNQVLWLLWRRLRASRHARASRNAEDSFQVGGRTGFSLLSLDSSGSDSSSESWRSLHSDADTDDSPPGCATS
ncbi:DDB1- and CUL4-associated factor 8-like isoform X2 [Sitophilus oryzae]|uniref:DDB1- and CUL4-associated factor 8-like isoform X2 n=1 Tax=Sitophilus oryzae TaxID=7048 RepID=A0A6J2XIK8_SITOR|nr:DDB1- and CUL4-associated factor 8-like isoform X2 [Sitophilus oryzae]